MSEPQELQPTQAIPQAEPSEQSAIANEHPSPNPSPQLPMANPSKQNNWLPIKTILTSNGKQHTVQFSPRLHNFQLTNSIFNLDDQSSYKLNPRFNELKHLQLMKQFFQKHDYNPSSIRLQKHLVSNKMKQNVDAITYQLLGKYQLDQNFEEAIRLLELAQYIGIEEFKQAMFVAVGVGLYIEDTDQAIEQFKNKHGLTDLTVEQEDEIIKQHQPIFQKIQKQLMETLRKEVEFYSRDKPAQ